MGKDDGKETKATGIKQLSKNNYITWKRDIQLLLEENDLFVFTDETGTAKEPPATATEEAKAKYAKRKLRSCAILINSVFEEFRDAAVKHATTKLVWEHLKQVFEPSSRSRKAKLREDFCLIQRKNDESMSTFIDRVDTAGKEVEALKMTAAEERTYTLINRVGDGFDSLRQIIDQWDDNKFTFENVSMALLAEDNYRRLEAEKSAKTSVEDNKAFSVTSRQKPKSKFGKGSPKATESENVSAPSASSASGDQRNTSDRCFSLQCFNCSGLGHFAKDCPSPRKKRDNRNANNSVVKNSDKVLSVKSGKRGAFYAHPIFDSHDTVALSSVLSNDTFYLDSACTNHVCSNKSLFVNFKSIKPVPLELGEGYSSIEGIGDIELITYDLDGIQNEVTLKNVCYAPKFKRNLISESKCDKASYDVHTHKGIKSVYKTNFDDCMSYAKLNSEHGLYELVGKAKLASGVLSADVTIDKSCNANLSDSILANKKDQNHLSLVELWHRRLGHQYSRGLNYLVGNTQVKGIEIPKRVEKLNCEVCKVAKSKRATFANKESGLTVSEPLGLLHMDLWGPSPVESLGDAKFLFCIVDDATRYAWVFPIRNKSDTFQTYVKFQKRVERMSGHKIKAVKTDLGEFMSNEFVKHLESEGVDAQRTNAYSPQMNGIAERVNQSVHDGVRAILDETQLPDQLWAELALMFIYLKNRFLHSGINNQVPYILFRKRDLQLKHLKILGSLAYVHVPTSRRESKHAPRAWKGVVVGYALSTRGYRVWDPSTDDVVESKHVEVDESRNWSEFESVNTDGKAIDKPELDKEEIYYDAETITDSDEDSSDDDNGNVGSDAPKHVMLPTPVKPTIVLPTQVEIQVRAEQIAGTPLPSKVTARAKDVKSKAGEGISSKRVSTKSCVRGMPGWVKEVVVCQKEVTAGM
uniref:Endonuclease n=1 Tax=Strigamia maritima TaxID=126957 RepID=T1J0W8_STRMM